MRAWVHAPSCQGKTESGALSENGKIWIEEVAFSTRSMLYNRLQRQVYKTSVVVTWYVIFRATVYTVTARIKFAKVHIWFDDLRVACSIREREVLHLFSNSRMCFSFLTKCYRIQGSSYYTMVNFAHLNTYQVKLLWTFHPYILWIWPFRRWGTYPF